MKLAGSPMLLEWCLLPPQGFDNCTPISNYHQDVGIPVSTGCTD